MSGVSAGSPAILFALDAERLAGFGDLLAVVEVFDGLLEADSDKEANDDGGDVDEEVAPSAGGVVGWVDVKHGGGFLWSFGRSVGLGRWRLI
jgi:hypothetical protein